MSAYYNEVDPFAAAWLRELMAEGLIAPGEVDTRSIEDVHPDDLTGFTQCHFFAGIGTWSYALRRAGWPDDRPVWTGSCPCQPFSAAGKGKGFADERHLWPALFHLIGQCRPVTLFGEQVASKHGLAWLDLVQADLEGTGYAVGAVDSCAAGFGAPHLRQRLYWVAHLHGERLHREQVRLLQGEPSEESSQIERQRRPLQLAHTNGARIGRHTGTAACSQERLQSQGCQDWGGGNTPFAGGANGWLADAVSAGRTKGRAGSGSGQAPRLSGACRLGHPGAPGSQVRQRASLEDAGRREQGRTTEQSGRPPHGLEHPAGFGRDWREVPTSGHDHDGQNPGRPQGQHGPGLASAHGVRGHCPDPVNGFWQDADWLLCRDGKFRPVEPGTFPLAHGAAARVGRLRAYGNAIVAPQAQAFIRACMDALAQRR